MRKDTCSVLMQSNLHSGLNRTSSRTLMTNMPSMHMRLCIRKPIGVILMASNRHHRVSTGPRTNARTCAVCNFSCSILRREYELSASRESMVHATITHIKVEGLNRRLRIRYKNTGPIFMRVRACLRSLIARIEISEALFLAHYYRFRTPVRGDTRRLTPTKTGNLPEEYNPLAYRRNRHDRAKCI